AAGSAAGAALRFCTSASRLRGLDAIGSARALPRWFGFVTSVTRLDAARPRPYLNEPSFSRGVPAAARDPRERGTATVQAREQRNDKRARILDAAVEVLADRGYFSPTVAEIARAAGVAVRAIHPHCRRQARLTLRLLV